MRNMPDLVLRQNEYRHKEGLPLSIHEEIVGTALQTYGSWDLITYRSCTCPVSHSMPHSQPILCPYRIFLTFSGRRRRRKNGFETNFSRFSVSCSFSQLLLKIYKKPPLFMGLVLSSNG